MGTVGRLTWWPLRGAQMSAVRDLRLKGVGRRPGPATVVPLDAHVCGAQGVVSALRGRLIDTLAFLGKLFPNSSRPIRNGLKTARFSDSSLRLPCPKTPCRDRPQPAQNQIQRIFL